MLNKFFIVAIVSPLLFLACAQHSDKPAKPAAENGMLLTTHVLDTIEQFFGNENWQMVNGNDTSYYNFSRQNDQLIKIYHYSMVKGDSSGTLISEINADNDRITWHQPSAILMLQKSGHDTLVWQVMNESINWKFQKVDDQNIVFLKGNKTIKMTRTIALSDFLQRSRYDFTHGTRYAFSDTSFTTKKPAIDIRH